MDSEAVAQFVEAWGSMGTAWGVNRSTARIHALLMASDRPLGLEDIAERLSISRGNTSMCLKELRSWGVIRKAVIAGERKERYFSESDPWTMLFRIARERKRREFDPALGAVRAALEGSADSPGLASKRLQELEAMFSTFDAIAERALTNEGTARALLQFVASR